jgi:hypothetical protein
MNRFAGRRWVFALAWLALTAGCAGGGSSTSSLTSPTAPSSLASVRPADYYDGYPDPADPAPVAPALPAPAPPAPAPVPLPPPLIVNIVGAAGPAAFAPNPLEGAIGATLAWKNSDLLPHNIVLDDGTVVGTVAPGQTSAAVPMNTPTVAYHCTFHPTMVGTVSVPGAVPPPAAAPAPAPTPAPPPSEPSPSPPGYEYYRVRR